MIALAATPASRLGHLRHLLVARGPLLLFALLLVFFALRAPYFLDWQNLATILKQSARTSSLDAGGTEGPPACAAWTDTRTAPANAGTHSKRVMKRRSLRGTVNRPAAAVSSALQRPRRWRHG